MCEFRPETIYYAGIILRITGCKFDKNNARIVLTNVTKELSESKMAQCNICHTFNRL